MKPNKHMELILVTLSLSLSIRACVSVCVTVQMARQYRTSQKGMHVHHTLANN